MDRDDATPVSAGESGDRREFGPSAEQANPQHIQKPAANQQIEPARYSSELVTEDLAALEFARRYAGRLRFDHDAGKWYEWTGTIWRENNTKIAFHHARELVRRLAIHEQDRVRYVVGKAGFAGSVERYACADPVLAVTSEHWDRNGMLLGTPRGVVDLRTGHVRDGRPQDGITKMTAVAPAEKADCPLWTRFLQEAAGGDTETIRFLQRWCGYCLTGDTRAHAVVFIVGDGGNGKTVFVNTLAGILADYCVTADMGVFLASPAERHSTELAMLRCARLVTASETERSRNWAEARLKQLTGGDPVTARFMRQDNFTFTPAFKLMFVGNHLPSLRSVDSAMRRRLNIIRFDHTPAVPDHGLEAKLRAEWPAILRWAIEGCLEWQSNGLAAPSSVKKATEEYFDDEDLMGQWIAEKCDVAQQNSATSADLFRSWGEFERQSGNRPWSKRDFGQELKRRGFKSIRGAAERGYRGIALKRDANDVSDAES